MWMRFSPRASRFGLHGYFIIQVSRTEFAVATFTQAQVEQSDRNRNLKKCHGFESQNGFIDVLGSSESRKL